MSKLNNLKEILFRIKNRDFSGNTGLAVKNSAYQFSTNMVAKVGSMFFAIILARLLTPEFFGLYNLFLSVILLFVSFAELGISVTLINFVSKEYFKKQNKAVSYIKYIWKVKLIFISASIFLLIASSYFLSEFYFKRPVFLEILAGCFIILIFSSLTFFENIFQAMNNFKMPFFKELIIQISKLSLIPVLIFLSVRYFSDMSHSVLFVIISLAISYLVALLFLIMMFRKDGLLSKKNTAINSKEKNRVRDFLILASPLAFSSIFFGYIDRIILGYFVKPEFIGYYSAAFGLIGGLISISSFGIVFLPLFNLLGKDKLEKGFIKSLQFSLIIGTIFFVVSLLLAPIAIKIVYGSAYSDSINIFKWLSILLIIYPAVGIYSSYFTSKNKLKIIGKILIVSTILNIILNYVLISSFSKQGDLAAVYGAVIATIIGQVFYLGGFIVEKYRERN